MEQNRAVQISAEQLRAAHWGLLSTKGDPEVLEDLGIPLTEETLYVHVRDGAEVAELLQAVEPADPREGLTGKQLFRAVRAELALRRAS